MLTGGSSKLFLHGDLLGSVRWMSTGNAIRTEFVYDAWGNVVSTTGGDDCRYQYGGKEGYYQDPGTGLLKLGARYYDPVIGRFITKDPARDGVNWYAYCYDNPVGAVDPMGLSSDEDFGGIYGNFTSWDNYFDKAWNAVASAYSSFSGAIQNAGVRASNTKYGMIGEKIPFLSTMAWYAGDTWGRYDVGEATWKEAAGASVGYGGALLGSGLVLGVGACSAVEAMLPSATALTVTHWYPVAAEATLSTGMWVQRGGGNLMNWVMSGAAERQYTQYFTTSVTKGQLAWPSGFEFWKGFIGQRIYMGP